MNTTDKEFDLGKEVMKLTPSHRKQLLSLIRFLAWRDHGEIKHPLDILRGAVLHFQLWLTGKI